MSVDLDKLDSSLAMMVAMAETIHLDGRRDLSSSEAKAALGHLARFCADLMSGYSAAAAQDIADIKAVRRKVWDAKKALETEGRDAALVAEGWTPPEPAT